MICRVSGDFCGIQELTLVDSTPHAGRLRVNSDSFVIWWMSGQMSIQAAIERKLSDAFSPERLEVINESHQHAGHQETFDGTGETHFRVRIVSTRFAGMGRLARHRAINELLQEELDAGVHALALEPSAPDEAARR
jgi:BolA protein